jgi:hypothetical protein
VARELIWERRARPNLLRGIQGTYAQPRWHARFTDADRTLCNRPSLRAAGEERPLPTEPICARCGSRLGVGR